MVLGMVRSAFTFGTVLIALSISACGGSTSDEVSRVDGLSSVDTSDAGSGDGGVSSDASTVDGGDGGDGGATGTVVQVLVKSVSYSPNEVTVHPGDTVRWVWDRGRHNVVSGPVTAGQGVADGKFCNPGAATCDHAPLQGPPYTYEHVFTDVGDYPYFCTPHVSMGMVGTVHVVR
jgi:plastocyanin